MAYEIFISMFQNCLEICATVAVLYSTGQEMMFALLVSIKMVFLHFSTAVRKMIHRYSAAQREPYYENG